MNEFLMDAHMHFDLYKDKIEVLHYIEAVKSYTIAMIATVIVLSILSLTTLPIRVFLRFLSTVYLLYLYANFAFSVITV